MKATNEVVYKQAITTLLETIKEQEKTLHQNKEILKNLQDACNHTWIEEAFPHWSGYTCTLCSMGYNKLVSICYTPSNCKCDNMPTPSQYAAKEVLKKQQAIDECITADHPIYTEYLDEGEHCYCWHLTKAE